MKFVSFILYLCIAVAFGQTSSTSTLCNESSHDCCWVSNVFSEMSSSANAAAYDESAPTACCNNKDIYCSGNNVIKIYWNSSSLSGDFGESIGNLKNLQVLNLSHNNLKGNVFWKLQKLTNLIELDLGYNNFTGIISSVNMKQQLAYLSDVSNNNFTGSFMFLHPRHMPTLQKLFISNNSFDDEELNKKVFMDLSTGKKLFSRLGEVCPMKGLCANTETGEKLLCDPITDTCGTPAIGGVCIEGVNDGVCSEGTVCHEGLCRKFIPQRVSLSCNAAQDCCWVYQALKDNSYTPYVAMYGENFNAGCCDNKKVICSGNSVIKIYWNSTNMIGDISPALGNLKNLQVLNVSNNSYTGAIDFFKDMTNLDDLGNNKLQGSIAVLDSIPKLRKVYFGNNNFLTGNFELGKFKKLNETGKTFNRKGDKCLAEGFCANTENGEELACDQDDHICSSPLTPCSTDENCSKGFSCYDRKCMVTWTDSLENLANNMTSEYTIDFEKGLKDDVGYNLYSLGSPLISDTQATDDQENEIIPSKEEGRRSGIDSYVLEKFGNSTKSSFKSIASRRISKYYTDYLMAVKISKLTKAAIEGQASDVSYKLTQQVKNKLDEFVHEEWDKWKVYQKNQIDQMAEANGIQSSELAKRSFTVSEMGNYDDLNLGHIGDFFTQIGNWVISVVEAVANVIKDGIHVVMKIVNGMSDFLVKLAEGDFSGAFAALGNGFIDAFNEALHHVIAIQKGIWKGLVAIKDIVVSVYKALSAMSPGQWACLIISLVMGVALSVIFTPIALGAFGIAYTSWGLGAVAVSVYVEGTIMLAQILAFDPLIDQTVNGEDNGENKSNERPPTQDFGNGITATLDKERNEYCYTESSEYYCFNESREQLCMIKKELEEPICLDGERWYIDQYDDSDQDSESQNDQTKIRKVTKSYYDPESGSWDPPLKGYATNSTTNSTSNSSENTITVDGFLLTLNQTENKYCYDSADKKHVCLDEKKHEVCYTSREFYLCKGKKGWYTQIDGVTYTLGANQEWVAES